MPVLPPYRNQSIDLHSTANQLTGFYMRATLALTRLRNESKKLKEIMRRLPFFFNSFVGRMFWIIFTGRKIIIFCKNHIFAIRQNVSKCSKDLLEAFLIFLKKIRLEILSASRRKM